jgi:hypothetical protein
VALKACTVIVHDLNETAHSLDVTAETLFEAVAQALATVRGQDWVGEIGRGLTTVILKVRSPEVTHIVKVQDFENWLNRGCKSPKETALKAKLRTCLARAGNDLRSGYRCVRCRIELIDDLADNLDYPQSLIVKVRAAVRVLVSELRQGIDQHVHVIPVQNPPPSPVRPTRPTSCP